MEHADQNLVDLLNQDEEKENYQKPIAPTMNELLSITDAAVQALEIKSPAKNSGPNQPLCDVQPNSVQLHSLSPDQIMALYGDSELDKGLNNSNMPNTVVCANEFQHKENNRQHDSLGSSSTNAILIKSTNSIPKNTNNSARNTENDAHNTSCISARSDVSLASSGFLTGSAHRVKVSSKKLKEVKSPFENLQPVSMSDHGQNGDKNIKAMDHGPSGLTVGTDIAPPLISMNRSSEESESSPGELIVVKKHSVRKEESAPTKKRVALSQGQAEDIIQKQEKAKQQYQVERHVPKAQMASIISKKMVEPQAASTSDDSMNNSAQIYRDFKNQCIITDVHGSDQNVFLNNSRGSSKQSFDPNMMATTSSKINAEVASNASSKKIFGFTDTGSLFIEDVIAGAMNDSAATPSFQTSLSEGAYSQADIQAAADSIVTVNAQDKIVGNMTSGSEGSCDNYPYALQDRFGKYRPAGLLRQGAPVDGVDPQKCHATSDSDITVTQYGLSDRERQIRSKFVKRQHHGGPIKRVVQPRVIPTSTTNVAQTTTTQSTNSSSDAITTAAVAASAAVAATQPFLRAQQEVENRMAEILEKLSILQGSNPQLALGSTVGSMAPTEKSAGGGSETSGKVEELEKQLDSLTQRRLDYLEKMHERQMMVQAKLLSISRLPGASSSSEGDKQQSHWSEESRWRPSGVTNVTHADTARAEKYKNYKSPTKPKNKEEREKSVLDTPAPRRKPPTPMSFEQKKSSPKTRSPNRSPTRARSRSPRRERPRPFGFLEEIMSGHDDTPLYGPFNQTPPNSLPTAHTRSRLEGSPSTVNKANELVNELKDLKQEMRNALVGGAPVHARHLETSYRDNHSPAFASFNTSGPFPLDQFLKSSTVAQAVSSSPYPSLEKSDSRIVITENGSTKTPGTPNAPVVQRYREAEDVLQNVQQNRAYLESNLDAILRQHKDTEVVNFIEEITRDASAAERLRIKKMVDKHIASMNTELEREIMEEMLKLEEAQKTNRSFMVAERDTNNKIKGKPGLKGKGRVGSRIDSGLKKPGTAEPTRPKSILRPTSAPTATNKSKVTAPKKRASVDPETYLTRVYGKSLYHGIRNSQRDPKVRYNAASPSSKLARSPPRPAAKAAAPQQRTASAAAPYGQGENYYFTPATGGQQVPTHAGVVAAPVDGQLIPMAIPLRAPRQESSSGGRPPGGPHQQQQTTANSIQSTPQANTSAPFASTPLENHFTPRPQVSLREEDSAVHPPGAPVDNSTPATGAGKQEKAAMSPIRQPASSPRHNEDYSISSETATTARHQPPQPQPQLPLDTAPQEADEQSAGYEQDFEEDDDDTVTESWEEGGIALPGHQPPPTQPYHGPTFPPKAPGLTPANSSDVLGSDLRRRDIVANKAMEWVEQELLARLLSEIAEQRALEEAMRRPLVEKPKPMPGNANDSECSSINSEQEPILAEALGREGLQMFVDAGVPVDDKLVSALVKEVLQEKISGVTGQMTAADADGPTTTITRQDQPPAPRPRSRPQSPSKQIPTENKTPRTVTGKVPTPETTPRSSPHVTPRQRVSPPATPDLTPVGSLAEPPPAVTHPSTSHVRPRPQPQPDPDTTDTESYPFEEYHPPPMPSEEPGVPYNARYDVRTPPVTPPPSPPDVASGNVTPDLSVQEVVRPSEPTFLTETLRETKSETRERGTMVNMVKIVRAMESSDEDYDLGQQELEMVVVDRSRRQRRPVVERPHEPSPPPTPQEPSPAPSPEPESEPVEEEEEEAPEPTRVEPAQPPRPDPVTIATQTAPPEPQQVASPTTSTQEEETLPDESTTSAEMTVDDAISEGEWLLTMHSEGEVRPVPILNAGAMKALERGGGSGPVGGRRPGVDDTLHDYSDLDYDREQSTDFEPSEGEFLHHRPGGVPPDQDPMFAYLHQMQKAPMRVLEEQLKVSQMAAARGQQYPGGVDVRKSMGEVSYYQQQNGQRPHPGGTPGGAPRPVLVQPRMSGTDGGPQMAQPRKISPPAQSASMGEVPSPGELEEGSATTADSISDSQVDVPTPGQKNVPIHSPPGHRRQEQEGEEGEHSSRVPPVEQPEPPEGSTQGDSVGAHDVTNDVDAITVRGRDVDVTGNGCANDGDVSANRPPGGSDLRQGLATGSPGSSMERAPRLSDARKSGMIGGPIMSTDHVGRGGRRGGRAGPRGRFGGGGSRPQTPDDGPARGGYMGVRGSQDSDMQDTMESVDGLRSTAGSDLRTMTPDQMNIEALLQSGQYLNTTGSTDGGGGSTTDFGRTGDMGTVRSTDFTHSGGDDLQCMDATGGERGLARSAEDGAGTMGSSAQFSVHGGGGGTRSQQFGSGQRYAGQQNARASMVRSSVDSSQGELDADGLLTGTFGRSGRLTYTTTEFDHSGTGSEYSYHPGEETGEYAPGDTMGSLQGTGHYADSLEGTGTLGETGESGSHYGRQSSSQYGDQGSGEQMVRQSLQVSVTIPSMAQSDSASELSASVEDVSEISMA